MLEIADREFTIEAIVVLFGELIVPGRAALCSCVVAEEPRGWRLSLCTPENVCNFTCVLTSRCQIRLLQAVQVSQWLSRHMA